MKKLLLTLIFLLISFFAFSQKSPCKDDICVVQFNAGWNSTNDVEWINELNEDTSFKVSLKTLGGIAALIFTLVGMWFTLQADIAEAKELPIPPPPDVTRMEFDMKDKNIRLTIQNTADDVEEIKEDLKRMEDKIDKLR